MPHAHTVRSLRADDLLPVVSFADGDIVTVTTVSSEYTFAMISVSDRLARLFVVTGGIVKPVTHATIMASRIGPSSSSGTLYGCIGVGLHLEFYTHQARIPRMLVLEPMVVTSPVQSVAVNGDLILPRPQEAMFH